MADNPLPNTVTFEFHDGKGWGIFHNHPLFTPAARGYWDSYDALLRYIWDRLPALDYPECSYPNKKACPAIVKCRSRCGFESGCINEWGCRLKKEQTDVN